MTTPQVIERLTAYSERLRQSLYRATSLYACFRVLNDDGDLRGAVNRTPAVSAASIIQNALLRELILILVRAFDTRGRRFSLEETDKVSFPVIREWLDRPLVQDELIARARVWFDDGFRDDENEAAVRDAISDLGSRLDQLATEEPNRQQRLRNFRDDFLAHELHRDVPRDPPLYDYIGQMLKEFRLLYEAVHMALEGGNTDLTIIEQDTLGSTDWLWRSVANAKES